jgi:hypothetical protein
MEQSDQERDEAFDPRIKGTPTLEGPVAILIVALAIIGLAAWVSWR